MARKFAAAHGLGDEDVIVDRQQLEELQDALYCLQAAIEDVEGDLQGKPTAAEVRSAINWLLDNARPVASARIEPRADARS
jgi:hypothetical protein